MLRPIAGSAVHMLCRDCFHQIILSAGSWGAPWRHSPFDLGLALFDLRLELSHLGLVLVDGALGDYIVAPALYRNAVTARPSLLKMSPFEQESAPRSGGPAACPLQCDECPSEREDHHWGIEYMGFAVLEPEHPAALAGHEMWTHCKHCQAWSADEHDYLGDQP